MTDYESLARRVLGCESRERRGRLWCETHDEPWECPRATEVADDLREAWRAEADALLERLSVEQSLGRCRCGALLTEDGDTTVAALDEARERLRHILDEGFGYDDSEESIQEVLACAAIWRSQDIGLQQRAEAAEARIEAVRALHIFEGGCYDDDPNRCYECGDEWPCPTIAALGGSAASTDTETGNPDGAR